jgi:hypothetical protein
MADMEVSRANSSSPFSPRSTYSLDSSSSQESGFLSLIKYVPTSTMWGGDMEKILTDFYTNGICPGRTVATQSNAYTSMLQVANTCPSTHYALLSLSASYIREYIPSQKEAYHQAELFYSTQALKALTAQISSGQNYDGALATSMLLMHHAAVNSEDSPLCWSCHANVFDTIPSDIVNHHSDAALFVRTQLALSRTAQTCYQLQNTQFHSLEKAKWYDDTPSSETQKICVTLGLSPQLLFLISSITSLATDSTGSSRLMHAQTQEKQLQDLRQWTSEPQSSEREVLLATAESFRLAALIYLRSRVYGYVAQKPNILIQR